MSHQKPTLEDFLEDSAVVREEEAKDTVPAVNNSKDDDQAKPVALGMCIECGDQPATLNCENCADDYCDVCFYSIHKRGTRKNHKTRQLKSKAVSNNVQITPSIVPLQQQPLPVLAPEKVQQLPASSSSDKMQYDEDEEDNSDEDNAPKEQVQKSLSLVGQEYIERSKYIPIRLSYGERKYLRLLESTLKVSEYTDKVDIASFKSKTARIHEQVKDICAILSGLVVASDYKVGQELIKEKNFKDNEQFFQAVFEIGRRYKILNPERMRSEYGKLLYFLMDTQLEEVQDLLQFKCVTPIKMVYNILHDKGGSQLLCDDLIQIATMEIIGDNKSRAQIQKEIKQKERAIDYLADKYSNINLSPDTIKNCLYSIGDNNNFLRQSRDACDKMIEYLVTYFGPNRKNKSSNNKNNEDSDDDENDDENEFDLSISAGVGGARLSHSHASQYNYVLQSLMLWREVSHEMFKLWYYSESDLLNSEEYPYRLRDTGQGLNRVQPAPRVYKIMSNIVYKIQQKVGGNWVGSSVIHLGDHNVPNAFMFIDKYTQVPRILAPILTTIRLIDDIAQKQSIQKYLTGTFGSLERLKKMILCDFFRHGFDGSGAEDFFSAGSCIDGRLTSAWNWTSTIEKKPYFPAFLLTGFIGFDGAGF